MSEHITHVAVYDDTVRLLQYSGRFTQAFKECKKKEYDSGWIASGSNGNHIWAVPLLKEYREKIHCWRPQPRYSPQNCSSHWLDNTSYIRSDFFLKSLRLFIFKLVMTHIITNLSASELESIYGNRIRSRMREMFNLVAFERDTKDKRV